METRTAMPPASVAFEALATSMRGALKRHCYRMMGGLQDAEDCVQETLLRGWREFASLRDGMAAQPWLYTIATRVCLDALRTRRRRQRLFGPSLEEIEPGTEPWVEPWRGGDDLGGTERGHSLRLAFVSLLQGLSPRSRAVLLLHDLVGMSVEEAGEALGLSLASARSALQRARAALPAAKEAPVAELPVEAYVNAWRSGDVHALIGLLHRDIVLTMPPWQRTFIGRDEVSRFMVAVWPRYEAFEVIATVANGQPAIALYAKRDGGAFMAHSLHVLSGAGLFDEIVLYAPPLGAQLISAFGLPLELTK